MLTWWNSPLPFFLRTEKGDLKNIFTQTFPAAQACALMNVLCAGGDAAPAAPADAAAAAGGGAGAGAGAAWVGGQEGDVKRIYLDQTRPATHMHTKNSTPKSSGPETLLLVRPALSCLGFG